MCGGTPLTYGLLRAQPKCQADSYPNTTKQQQQRYTPSWGRHRPRSRHSGLPRPPSGPLPNSLTTLHSLPTCFKLSYLLLSIGKVGGRFPRVLMRAIALPAHQVLGPSSPTPLALAQQSLHFELHSRALILQGYRCRNTGVALHSLQLAAVEDRVDPPCWRQLQPPSFCTDFLHQLEGSCPLGSQLPAPMLQGKMLGVQPHLVPHQE